MTLKRMKRSASLVGLCHRLAFVVDEQFGAGHSIRDGFGRQAHHGEDAVAGDELKDAADQFCPTRFIRSSRRLARGSSGLRLLAGLR